MKKSTAQRAKHGQRTIRFIFGDKHKEYIRRCADNVYNVAEGAVRAGKSVANVYAFYHELKTTPDKIHIATGATLASAKMVIGDSNGYGLEHLLRGQCRWGKYKNNDALICKGPATGYREKIIIFAGGAKADSYKKIRGSSYGMWIATEINLHHDSMIKECFARQLVAKRRKIFWDLNPETPRAPIYTDYLDAYQSRAEKGELLGGYNYAHFSIFDNPVLTERRRQEIISQYQPGTVWYRRDINGERCAAEGLIYQEFADNADAFLIDNPKKWLYENNEKLTAATIGVDYGGSGSATAAVCTGITATGKVVVLDEAYIDHKRQSINPSRLNAWYADFVRRVTAEYGMYMITRADSAEQILINGFKSTVQAERLQTEVHNALKTPIIGVRVRLELLLFAQKRLFINRDCRHIIQAFSDAVYDDTKLEDTRLDNGSTNIDSLDAFEYSIEQYAKQLERMGQR